MGEGKRRILSLVSYLLTGFINKKPLIKYMPGLKEQVRTQKRFTSDFCDKNLGKTYRLTRRLDKIVTYGVTLLLRLGVAVPEPLAFRFEQLPLGRPALVRLSLIIESVPSKGSLSAYSLT